MNDMRLKRDALRDWIKKARQRRYKKYLEDIGEPKKEKAKK